MSQPTMADNRVHEEPVRYSEKIKAFDYLGASLSGEESACSVGDAGSVLGLGRSPRVGNSSPLQYCLENPLGQGSLAGCSLWS